MPSILSDDALLRAIADGDRQALAILYGRYNQRLFRFARRLIPEPSMAEDLVQEVFLDVWRTAGKFRHDAAVATWLLAITYRRRCFHCAKPIAQPSILARSILTYQSRWNHRRSRSSRRIPAERWACLDQIPAHQKLILELRYYQDQSIAEIAIVLDVPENTVKSRLFQARKKLGEALSSLGIDGK